MNRFSAQRALAASMVSLLGCAVCIAQEQPFTRTFQRGTTERYKIELTLKTEVQGVTTETIGAKTYVKPYVHAAQATLEWTATRRTVQLTDSGGARIEEDLSGALAQCDGQPDAGTFDPELQKSLREFCANWKNPRALAYEESKQGSVRNPSDEREIALDEANPALLSLWLRRAIRPNVTFPGLPFRIGSKQQRNFQPLAANWAQANGSEAAEWLESQGEIPSAILHVSQQLTWTEPPKRGAGTAAQPEARASFYADSMTTVSLLDGSVQSAARSASRELRRALDPVEGLSAPPEFRTKLTAIVTVRRLS